MKPGVQGKLGGNRSHPPLNRMKDWLFGGPSHRTAVTGDMNQPTITTTHKRKADYVLVSSSFPSPEFQNHNFDRKSHPFMQRKD